jgi:hypothetical protein
MRRSYDSIDNRFTSTTVVARSSSLTPPAGIDEPFCNFYFFIGEMPCSDCWLLLESAHTDVQAPDRQAPMRRPSGTYAKTSTVAAAVPTAVG